MNASRRGFLKLSSTLALGSVVSPFLSLADRPTPLRFIERAAFTMGSIVTIKAYCPDVSGRCHLGIDEAFREMKAIDRLMSVFDASSQLSEINRRASKEELHIDHRILEVLSAAQKFHTLTDGAFDLTIEPLMKLYGFRDDTTLHHFPSDKQIGDVLDGVGMRHVQLNAKNSTISIGPPSTRLDFGGIAVGYAIDRAATILRKNGIASALINHSGDLYAIGAPPDTDGWDVGITDPMHTDSVITTVRIKDQALSTSGNYQNFVKADGKTIGHILNPSSGRSASSTLSGTVIAPTATEADALSTGFFVLGIEKSRPVIRRSKNVKCITVISDGDSETIVKMTFSRFSDTSPDP